MKPYLLKHAQSRLCYLVLLQIFVSLLGLSLCLITILYSVINFITNLIWCYIDFIVFQQIIHGCLSRRSPILSPVLRFVPSLPTFSVSQGRSCLLSRQVGLWCSQIFVFFFHFFCVRAYLLMNIRLISQER